MPPFTTNLTSEEICAAAGIETDGTLPEPDVYLAQLFAERLFPVAVRFLAHAQQPHACIEWGAQALLSIPRPPATPEQEAALQEVQAWLAKPGESERRAAKDRADAATLDTADGILAMAVFFSGGSISPPPNPEVPPPAFTCHKFVTGAVVLAVVGHQPEKAAERFQTVLALRHPAISKAALTR